MTALPPSNQACASEVVDYFRLVLPFFGSLLAVFFGFWLRGFETQSSYLQTRVQEITEELDKLITAGSTYWKFDSQHMVPEEEVALEAELQGRMHTINSLFEDLADKFAIHKADMTRLRIRELRRTLTGGTFASTQGHAASGTVISTSYSEAADLRVSLQACLRKGSH